MIPHPLDCTIQDNSHNHMQLFKLKFKIGIFKNSVTQPVSHISGVQQLWHRTLFFNHNVLLITGQNLREEFTQDLSSHIQKAVAKVLKTEIEAQSILADNSERNEFSRISTEQSITGIEGIITCYNQAQKLFQGYVLENVPQTFLSEY